MENELAKKSFAFGGDEVTRPNTDGRVEVVGESEEEKTNHEVKSQTINPVKPKVEGTRKRSFFSKLFGSSEEEKTIKDFPKSKFTQLDLIAVGPDKESEEPQLRSGKPTTFNLAELICYHDSVQTPIEEIVTISGLSVEDITQVVAEAKQMGLYDKLASALK